MDFDAIILAGGAGTRLGGADKAALRVGDETLLDRTLDAVSAARQIVVVGERTSTDDRVTIVCERPAGGGPAAAIGAGVQALDGDAVVVVLACDMPGVAAVVPVLLDGLASVPAAQGVLARDGDRVQYLAGAHRLGALRAVIEGRGSLGGVSVRSLLDDLDLHILEVPPGSTADIDTWDDAARAGVTP